MGGPKRFSKGIRIADNPLSRNIARIFNQSDEDGLLLVRENDRYKEKAGEIRERIVQKYNLEGKTRNTFKETVFIHWMRPSTDNPSMPYHNPTLQDIARLCEVIDKDLWEMFLEPDQINLNRLPQENRELIRKIVAMADNKDLLNAVRSIIEVYEKTLEAARREQTREQEQEQKGEQEGERARA